MNRNSVPVDKIMVLIPSLNPDKKLEKYIKELIEIGFIHILVVDDGSRRECQDIFKHLDSYETVTVLHHEVNRGKGRALKTGFAWCLEHFTDCQGVVTADSDGQHSPADTRKVAEALASGSGDLILGTRNFNEEQVPFKSRYGNKITTVIFALLYGKYIHDTQTGLRGIRVNLLPSLCGLSGERFEYEIKMLIFAARQKLSCKEVLIETIYIDENKETHFHPVKDSARIYGVMFGSFFRYLLSSISASLLDMGLFAVFHLWVFGGMALRNNVFLSTLLARCASSVYNFSINRKLVFGAQGSLGRHLVSYYLLVIVQMGCSAGLVYFFTALLSGPAVFVKMIVDTCLFLVSFQIQQRFIFRD